MNHSFVTGLLAITLGLASGGATAALVAGDGATPPQTQRAVLAAPVAPAGATSVELVGGVIQAVDVRRRTLTLRGKPVALHATRLQILDAAGQNAGDLASLRAGQRIRFALAPGHAPDRGIVLIYIDRQP